MKLLLIFTFLFCCSVLYSQDKKGFYGTRFFLSADLLLNTPFLNNLASDGYPDKLNFGYRGSFGFNTRRNTAIGIETGMYYSSIDADQLGYMNLKKPALTSDYNSYDATLYSAKLDRINIRTFSIMPKLEIAVKNALLPLGLSHQIGVGYSNSTVVDKDYAATFTPSYNNTDDILSEDFLKTRLYKFNNQRPIRTLTLMYGLSMRQAITKHWLINYGFRYTLNLNMFYFSETYPSNTETEYFISDQQMSETVHRERLCNVITFNIGTTYAF